MGSSPWPGPAAMNSGPAGAQLALVQTDTWQVSQPEPELNPPQATYLGTYSHSDWRLNECSDVLLQTSPAACVIHFIFQEHLDSTLILHRNR